MFGRNKHTDKPAVKEAPKTESEKLHESGLTWEASRIYQIEKSEKRAWMIAGIAIACVVLLVLAVVLMLPLKENTPYVIRVDNTTGVPDIVTAMDTKGVAYDDVMDKYWLVQYIRAYESYDWYTLQKDYNTVGLLSSPSVGKEYASLFEGKEALDKRYGNRVSVQIEIMSVVPNGNGIGTVRFLKTTKRTEDTSSRGQVTKWVATVAYEYRNPSLIREKARLINPFGFQVLSYRVDSEMEVR